MRAVSAYNSERYGAGRPSAPGSSSSMACAFSTTDAANSSSSARRPRTEADRRRIFAFADSGSRASSLSSRTSSPFATSARKVANRSSFESKYR